jgi:hypothetical protein
MLLLYSARFLDMCVLAGFDYASTYAPLLDGGPFEFAKAVELVKVRAIQLSSSIIVIVIVESHCVASSFRYFRHFTNDGVVDAHRQRRLAAKVSRKRR